MNKNDSSSKLEVWEIARKLNILKFCRFDENNYDSHAYFLSHCHTDHMKGLDCTTFHTLLNTKKEIFIYASPVSVKILKLIQPPVAAKLKSLPLEVPTLVPVKDKFVTVTLVRAGHCPGSVMFLFEYEGKIILYTGDYRIHKNDIRKFKAFKYPSGLPKHIHKIYIDTTFFYKNYSSFPSREQCVEEVCSIISEWTAKSKYHIVHLVTSARYGYEYLFIEISRKLGLPIHVCEREYKFYRCIPEMDKAVSLSSNSTPLHNNCGTSFQLICKQQWNMTIKTIRFSAMIWTENELVENGGIANGNDCIKVCYSTHASLEEGLALIRTLKPDAVEPCVVLQDTEKNKEMMELIVDVLREYKTDANKDESVCEKTPKMFVVKEEMHAEKSGSSDTEERCSLLESPPRIRRKMAERTTV